jgi:hypothetical protein
MPRDRVQRHRERVGEHRDLVGHRIRHREQHAVVGRHQLGVTSGHVGRHPGVDTRLDVAVGEAPAQAVVSGFACRTTRFDAAWTTRQPRVENDALPDLESARRRTQRHHVGDDFVTHHLGKRAERRHRVVGVALAEVEQDLLGVRAADPGQSWPSNHPIIVQRLRIRHISQAYRRVGQVAGERIGVVGHLERLWRHAEYQRPHGRAIPAAPAM